MFSAAVGEIVAGDGGNDDVCEIEFFDGPGEALRFVILQRQDFAVIDGTELTVAGTDITHNHKGGGAVGVTFAEIGAGGAGANGVKMMMLQDLHNVLVVGAFGQGAFEPGGQTAGSGIVFILRRHNIYILG
jgi:hypothetical protein